MKTKRSVLWFDDEFNDRRMQIQFVAKSLGLRPIDALALGQDKNGEIGWPDVVDVCADKCDVRAISLIVVDDNLSSHSNGAKSFNKGSSLCGALRDRFRDVPIVGISNADASLISREQKEEYSYFLNFLAVRKSSNLVLLKSMVRGFEDLRQHADSSCEDAVFMLMKVPDTSADWLRKVMPVALRSGKLAGNARAVFRWLNDEVFAFQGGLVDSMNVSSMVGLKEEFFLKKVAPRLHRKCKYEGVFSSFWGTWFWRHEVLMELAKAAKDYGSLELSRYCTILAPRMISQWAVCANCGQRYTELAADAECNGPREERIPAHRRCVIEEDVPHPIFFNSKYVIARGGCR